MRVQVVQKKHQGQNAVSLTLQSEGGQKLNSSPGQFITIHRRDSGVKRSYSIASHPLDAELASNQLVIGVKRVEGGALSPWLVEELQPGDLLEIDPPTGSFGLKSVETCKHIGFVAAGSGITPFLSMIKEVLYKSAHTPKVSLIYCNRSHKETMFSEEIEHLLKSYPEQLHVSYHLSSEKGRLDLARLEAWTAALHSPLDQLYVCGPSGLMDAVKSLGKSLNVPVFLESFDVKAVKVDVKQIADPDEGCIVVGQGERLELGQESVGVFRLDGAEHQVPCSPDQSLLEAAIRAGLNVPYSCMEGICFACLATLESGQVFMPGDVALDEDEIVNERKVLTCQCRVLSADVKINFDAV